MRTQNRAFRLTAMVAASGLVLVQTTPTPAAAQGAPPPPTLGAPAPPAGGDPPARVGRLALITGTVSYHAQDDTQWSPAAVNYPVTAGNAFWTQPGAQAEIEVSASRIAMAPATELDITALDDTTFQATEPQGESYLGIRAAAPGESYAMQTPRGLVTFAVPGRYDVAAGDTQTPTTVTVIEGSAQITGPGVSLQVGAGQAATLNGTDTFQGSVGPAQPDPFVTAMLNRDQAPRQSAAVPAVVAAMPGGDDLATYGSWSDSADYGQVWYPQVASGWVPYSDGYWSYVAPWGWTWVDSDPWGFAPFHYGRWADIGGRWGWVPGDESVYAPAMVTFFGVGVVAGVGIGAALAAGRIGWLPLGPHEAYHPWYHASDRYLQRVNAGRGINLTAVNRNATISSFANRRAATVVPTSAMTGSRPVRGAAQRVDPTQLTQARPVFGAQPVRPTTATAGVTPAVARQLHLAPTAGAVAIRPAPGPAIRSAGAVSGVRAEAATRSGLPPLHTPAGQGAAGAAPVRSTTEQARPETPGARAGTAGGTAGLPAPVAPGRVGAPPIEHGPGGGVGTAGARPIPSAPPGTLARPVTPETRPGAAGETAGLPALRAPVAPGRAGPPPIERGPGVGVPAAGARPIPSTAPGSLARPVPQVEHPAVSPPERGAVTSPVAHAPVPAIHPAPVERPATPQAFHAPAPVVHAAPEPVRPAPVARPETPQIVHAPPPVVHAAPPPERPAPVARPETPQIVHAPPPVVHAAPPPERPAPVARPVAPAAAARAAPAPQREKKPGEP
jgi:hypothetical protein